MSAQQHDLAALARKVVDGQRAGAIADGRTLLHSLHPAPVTGDAVRLEKLVRRLLLHMLDQSPAAGTTVVAVYAQGPHAVLAIRAVADGDGGGDGPTQAAPKPADPDLSLALAQRVVEQHGGSLVVEPGSHVTARLPLCTTPAEPASALDGIRPLLRRRGGRERGLPAASDKETVDP